MSAFAQWRAPNDFEIANGLAELAAIVGAETAALPSWQRRLVLSEPEGQWGLLVQNCAQPSIPSLAPWADPVQLQSWQDAFPLAEGVAILTGPDEKNPEKVLESRRRQLKDHEAEAEAARVARQAEAEQKQRDDAELAVAERQFGGPAWHKLDPWQQAFFHLALRVEPRDAELAADLRALARQARGGHPATLPFPRTTWDRP